MTTRGDALVGRGKEYLGLLRCLTWLKVGEHSLTGVTGPGGRGRHYLTAGNRKDAQRKGDTVFLVPAVGGRQAGGQGSPAGRGQGRGTTLKGQASFARALPVTYLPSTS